MIRTPYWFPWVMGLIAIIVSIPIDGLAGAGLALLGIVLILIGYAKSRRDREEKGR